MGFMDKLKGVSQVAAGVVGDVLVSVGNSLEKVSENKAFEEAEESSKPKYDFLEKLTYVGTIRGNNLPELDPKQLRQCVLGIFGSEYQELDPEHNRMVVYTRPAIGLNGDLEFVTEFSFYNIVSVKANRCIEKTEECDEIFKSKVTRYYYTFTIQFVSGATYELSQLVTDVEKPTDYYQIMIFSQPILATIEWIYNASLYMVDEGSKEVVNTFFKQWGGEEYLPFEETTDETGKSVYGEWSFDRVFDSYLKLIEHLGDYEKRKCDMID